MPVVQVARAERAIAAPGWRNVWQNARGKKRYGIEHRRLAATINPSNCRESVFKYKAASLAEGPVVLNCELAYPHDYAASEISIWPVTAAATTALRRSFSNLMECSAAARSRSILAVS